MALAVPTYRFTVPGVPVPKQRPRLGRTGIYTPARTRAHERLVWAHAIAAGVRPIVGPVALSCDFYLADPPRADVDNLAKTVLDALTGQAYADDRQVVRLRCTKHPSDQPHTDVRIYPT